MNSKELFNTLKRTINFSLKKTDKGIWVGSGAINMCPECAGMTQAQYDIHYAKAKNILESLPWTGKVEHPRSPQPGEYPMEDGELPLPYMKGVEPFDRRKIERVVEP